MTANADLAKRLTVIEADLARHAAQFGHHKAETLRALKVVFEALKSLAVQSEQPEPKPLMAILVGMSGLRKLVGRGL